MLFFDDVTEEQDDEVLLEIETFFHALRDSDFDFAIGDLGYDDAEEDDDEEDLDEALLDTVEDSMKWLLMMNYKTTTKTQPTQITLKKKPK